MARDPDAGLKRFVESARARSQDMCLPFYGMLVSRADNPSNGFVFRSINCRGDCSFGTCCSSCASRIVRKEIKLSFELDIQRRAGKSKMIQNIANNPILAANEIRTLRKKVRCLCSQLAQNVLSTEIDKNGTHLLEGELGDDIRRALSIMDGPVTAVLQNGKAPDGLELWRLHSRHIAEVDKNDGKGTGQTRVKYHPLLMNWAIAFLARTSARFYAEVAKIMILPHISHVYRKMAKFISSECDKAFSLHINSK